MTGAGPLQLLELSVLPEWVDFNGHMNDAAYAAAFSHGVEALMEHIGIDAALREARRYTLYTLESHIRYLREAHEGEALVLDLHLVAHDAKRLHVLMRMWRPTDSTLLATGEQMLIGIDAARGRPAPFPETVAARVEALARAQASLDPPEGVGRRIGLG